MSLTTFNPAQLFNSPGTVWTSGSGAPSDAVGKNGDFYFRTDTSGIYKRVSGAYGSPIATLLGSAGAGVAVGGTTGQVLKKASGTDYDTEWAADGGGGVPDGGTTGQVLAKQSGTDGDADWEDVEAVPPGGTAGQVLKKLSGTDGDADWRDLVIPPTDIGCSLSNSTLITIPSATPTLLTFDTENFDTDTCHDPGDPSKLTIKTAGKYLVVSAPLFQANTSSARRIDLMLNGASVEADVRNAAGTSQETRVRIAVILDLAVNDYLQVIAAQGSGSSLLLATGINGLSAMLLKAESGGGGGGGVEYVDVPLTHDSAGEIGNRAYDASNQWVYEKLPVAGWRRYKVYDFSVTLTHVSDGDSNGVFFYLGTNLGQDAWANPHTAGRIVVTWSSREEGVNADTVDRIGSNVYSTDVANSWVAVDLGAPRSLVASDYSIQNRGNSFAYLDTIRNWKLQGSNDVASNSTTDLAAATWTDIDIRTGDSTIAATNGAWGTFHVGATPAAYRWFRIIQTGVNDTGGNKLSVGELELYGQLVL